MIDVPLRPHQKRAVSQLENGKVLWGGVGSGKSRTALAYYAKKEAPRDIYVITTARKRDEKDWVGEAAAFGIGTEADATVAGVLTVDSWNNIDKYTDVSGAFVIFDEQRLVGSGKWTKAFIKIAKRNRWILLTATPGDTWLDYIPLFVANGFYKNRTEFKREHVVYNTYSKFPKVDRYIGVGRLVKHRNSLLVKMEFDRHTTRHLKDVLVDYDVELFKKVMDKRWHVYENRPLRDVAEMFSVMRKVVNSDESRLSSLTDICRSNPKVIVFYNFDYELEILRNGLKDFDGIAGLSTKQQTSNGTNQSNGISTQTSQCTPEITLNSNSGESCSLSTPGATTAEPSERSSLQHWSLEDVRIAEWNGHKHEPIPDSERWVYLVQYNAGAEAWNCIETNVMVFWSLTYSYKMFEQAQGRIDRMDTPFTDLEYYIFRSKSFIDSAILRSLRAKKSFNEAKFAEKHLKT